MNCSLKYLELCSSLCVLFCYFDSYLAEKERAGCSPSMYVSLFVCVQMSLPHGTFN